MELTRGIMLRNGILEEYHDKDFKDFYGHPEKIKELKPKVEKYNKLQKEGQDRIDLDFRCGEEIYGKVREYANNLDNAFKYGISLFLSGPNGTGKTLLAVSVLKEVIRKGFSGQMTSLGGIIELIAESWNDDSKKEIFNEKIKNVDFLLIDDVGKEYRAKSNDLVEVGFDNLIRYRSFRRKPFILTTNTSLADISNTYGQSIASLLAGKCWVIRVEGTDYRKMIEAKRIRSLLIDG